jgi:FHS family Na+ dependent glucose MFS transporter 1
MNTSLSQERSGDLVRTWAYFASFISLGLVTSALGPTLEGLAAGTGSDLAQISVLFVARSLGYLLGSLIGGQLVDRVPGHPLLAAMLFLMASSLAFTPVIPLLWLLALVSLVLSASQGVLDVGTNTLVVWLHGEDVSPFMNALHFFFGVGALVSPIIVGQALVRTGGITWAYWIMAVLMIPSGLWLLTLRSPAIGGAEEEMEGRGNSAPLIALIALFLLIYVSAETSASGWISAYALAQELANAEVSSYLASAFWGGLTLGRLASIPLAKRFSPRTVLQVDLLGAAASAALLLLAPHSRVALWSGTVGVGFFMASIFPTTLSFAGRRLRITGQVTAWFFVGASLGAMVLPWIIGQLFEPLGPWVFPAALLTDLVVAAGVFLVMLRYRPAG